MSLTVTADVWTVLGMVSTCVIVMGKASPIEAATEEGQEYAKQARDLPRPIPPEWNPGPPHVHRFRAFIVQCLKVVKEKKLKNTQQGRDLARWVQDLEGNSGNQDAVMQGMTMDEVEDQVVLFRTMKTRDSDKKKLLYTCRELGKQQLPVDSQVFFHHFAKLVSKIEWPTVWRKVTAAYRLSLLLLRLELSCLQLPHVTCITLRTNK